MSKKKNPTLPHQGRWLHATQKQFAESIIFVHPFGGSRSSVKHHQEFVAALGFDSVAFNLTPTKKSAFTTIRLLDDLLSNKRKRWATDITDILNVVKGPKIVFSLSFPSISAAMAIGEREGRDISAWVCDGGPFLSSTLCLWNYYTHREPTPNLLKKGVNIALGLLGQRAWQMQADLEHSLKEMPGDFPVLSVRAWQDKLVPLSAIEAAFRGQEHLNLQILTLPDAGHLQGLTEAEEEYKPRVAKFLTQNSKPIT